MMELRVLESIRAGLSMLVDGNVMAYQHDMGQSCVYCAAEMEDGAMSHYPDCAVLEGRAAIELVDALIRAATLPQAEGDGDG